MYNQLKHCLKICYINCNQVLNHLFLLVLAFLMDYIRSEINFSNYSGMVMIDRKKTFNTVDHSILKNKLIAIVPQKSILGPLLFL